MSALLPGPAAARPSPHPAAAVRRKGGIGEEADGECSTTSNDNLRLEIADVCFLSSPSAPGKGNASARSSLGFGRGEGPVSPCPAAMAMRKGGIGEEADGECSATSNDNLRWEIADMSNEELLNDIARVRSMHPAFGGLIDPEKRARHSRCHARGPGARSHRSQHGQRGQLPLLQSAPAAPRISSPELH
ncbi:hypothetical protein ZWY2020_046889 [Hordeum vulgare]|nr:hypothetical protein ZWY2020_046889 [Hordeum vulgare]